MEITSLSFAGFVIIVLVLYYLLPRRAQNCLLLAASYVFCATWAWEFPLALAVLTLFTYGLARGLHSGQRAKLWMGIGVNLLALAFLKYSDFFVPRMVDLLARLGVRSAAGGLQILLPVGLSFYVLQAISYLVDVYHGLLPASTDWVDFALYMAYFPRLLSGPIERARSFLPRLAQQRVVDNDVLARSFTLMVIGLVRKVVIADSLAAQMPPEVFEMPLAFSAPELAAWLLAYAFAIYSDFAGYSNIVRGVSGLFGIELSRNFAHPFFARSFTEFWNGWHISLSHWLRDYVFLPLSRALLRRNLNRRSLVNLAVPPMVTMAVSGLWHGANWHMLLWGALNGLYQVMERILSLGRPMVSPDRQPRWRQTLAMFTVVMLGVLGAVLFRMDLRIASQFWRGLLTGTNAVIPWLQMLLPIGLTLWIDWTQYRSDDELVFLRWPRLAQSTLLAAAMLALFLATRAEIGEPFVYQGF